MPDVSAAGSPMERVRRLLVLAPNWLGDAVMALPAVSDLRRHFGGAQIGVAARGSVAALFTMVPGVDEVLTLAPGGGWRSLGTGGDAERIRRGAWDAAVLLPNSYRSARLVHRAGVPERWGYRSDWRGRLLTRSVVRPSAMRLHQAEYYQHLVRALGVPTAPPAPALQVPAGAIEEARRLLAEGGWDGRAPLVGFAPGAAYGRAKQWPAERVGQAARQLSATGCTAVIVGASGDRSVAAAVARAAGGSVLNLAGRTTLQTLAGVMVHCSAFVSNDSGAMHLAAAAGVPVVAIFGPTREWATAPLPPAGGTTAVVLTGSAWCRPCMLRHCPLDHRCMTSIPAGAVVSAVARSLPRTA